MSAAVTIPICDIDRSFFEEHFARAERQLPTPSGLMTTFTGMKRKLAARDTREFDELLDEPIPVHGLTVLNAATAQALAGIERFLDRASPEARERARRLLGRRFERGTTLRDLHDCDVFAWVETTNDFWALSFLYADQGEVSPKDQDSLIDAIQHRWMHRAQRTPHMFFHEAVVGYLVNALKGNPTPERQVLTSQMLGTYYPLPAYFVSELAAVLGREPADIVALHFEEESVIEAALPPALVEMMFFATHLFFCLEFLVIHRMAGSGPVLNGLNQLYFALPALERWAARPTISTATALGPVVDAELCRRFYGGGGSARASETDIIRFLLEMEERFWDARDTR